MKLFRCLRNVPFLICLGCLLAITGCFTTTHAQDVTTSQAGRFVLDFDLLFDLKKPCDLTPALLEAKVATLAVIPDEKLCRPVKFPKEQCHYHWFSLKSSPRHNPVLSIFKSQIQPEFLSVVWQEEEMERFYCTYVAEKDQELPPQLIADMDASLGTAHAPSTRKKNAVEWNLEHYRVTAEYSTNVGKGDPRFLINVWNKAYKPKPAAISDNSSPANTTKGMAEINLDQIIDWKNPLDITKLAFEAMLKPYESASGPKVYSIDVGGATGDAFIISSSLTGNPIPMKMFGGKFQPSAMRIEWTNGKATRVNVIFPREAEVHTVDPALVAALDQKLGQAHVKTKGTFDDTHSWSFERHRVDYSAHNEQPKFYLSFYLWKGPAVSPVPSTPAVVSVPTTNPPSSPAAQQAPGLKAGAVDLDPLLKWENPLAFKPEDLDSIFKPQVESAGSKFWHDHTDGSTLIGAPGVTMTAFGGQLKIAVVTIKWEEPKYIRMEMNSLTTEEEESLYLRFDELTKVPRRRQNYSDSAILGYDWSTKAYRLTTFKAPNQRFHVNVFRPLGFDPNGPTEPLAANLDALLNFSTLWNTSPDAFEQLYTAKVAKKEDQKKPPQFEWMSADKSRARFSRQMFSNVETKLTMFAGSIKVEEAVVEFVNGKVAKSTISFYNRGDSGDIDVRDFDRIFKAIGQNLGQVLKVAPKRQLMSTNAALPVSGWMWTSPMATALLENNEYQVPGKVIKPEFLRLKLAAPGQTDYTMGKMVTGVQSMELVKRVTKKPEGEVYISGVPMVDQGQKGYCVAASCQRLFEYMRIPCDQHEMAQLVNVDAESGANVMVMQKSLAKIDGRFKVSFKPLVNPEQYYSGSTGKRRVSDKEFNSIVKEYVNKGVPLLWALELGRAAEEPPLPGAGQTRGGHMRMIIGYKMENNQITKILFTDSWGSGHELKRMAAYDAYDVTIGLYSMAPRGL